MVAGLPSGEPPNDLCPIIMGKTVALTERGGPDDMQFALGAQCCDLSIPIERHVDRHQNHVETAGQLCECPFTNEMNAISLLHTT